ncbi:endonuclease/exonuclease/phosphatase family protein [Andreprevotia chitinilytica]|uniref:endonuclease/exonuclease/phosphatase family protein n=1 Tax=Andreprevotia chitinilytica TaxID=396808 RepID=UPI0005506574|nr:endonuclease/exonuclease/phosphatase family protein [Andreprevotia chitinilytica]
MRIGSFNIEKSGESSLTSKKLQVETFVNLCCTNTDWDADLVFLCEIHSGLLDTYEEQFAQMYPTYAVSAFRGGYSNGYIVLSKIEGIAISDQGHLRGLNRDLLVADVQGVNGFSGSVLLAHFKSGRGGLTKSQLENCAVLGSAWVATGDLNWDIGDMGQLSVPALSHDCWNGMPTQRSGGILDWVLSAPDVDVRPVDLTGMADVFDMSAPDHRPILFDVRNG